MQFSREPRKTETSYGVKNIARSGVRLFLYLADTERTLETPTDKLLMSVAAYANEIERERITLRVYDGTLRRGRSGGGWCSRRVRTARTSSSDRFSLANSFRELCCRRYWIGLPAQYPR